MLIQLRDSRSQLHMTICNIHVTCTTRALIQIMTNEVGAFWQTVQEDSNEEIAEEHFWELLRGIVVEIDASMRTNMWIWL